MDNEKKADTNTPVEKEEVNEKEDNDNIFKSSIKTSFLTDIEEPEYAINNDDYDKYNEIMGYLKDNPDESEEKLFIDLESEYGETAEELRNFVSLNMQEAIDRDSGKSINTVELEDSDIQDLIKKFFEENVKNPSLLNIDAGKADVKITNVRSISKGEFTYDKEEYSYIIKTEHKSDFKSALVFQLKIDEKNIDLD